MTIKIFTFQQDEIDILEDWINYHGYLFGRENVYVIDHESKNSKELIKSKGVNLINFSGLFEHNKARQLTKIMQENKKDCDFLIPLDVDEFIIKKDGDNISSDKNEILKCFEELSECGSYKFVSYSVERQERCPTTEFNYVYDKNPDHGRFARWKTFWNNETFSATDQGNHGCEEGPYEKTKLALLHFHNRGFDHFKRKHLRWPNSYGKTRKPTPKDKEKHHWEFYYEKIKNMTEQEMFEYWKTLIPSHEEHNSNKYQCFKDTIKKLRT